MTLKPKPDTRPSVFGGTLLNKKAMINLAATLVAFVLAAQAAGEDRRTVEDWSSRGTNGFSPAFAHQPPIAAGPFQPNYESLKAYKCPQWYQDAKFGIWAHWGPQGVPEKHLNSYPKRISPDLQPEEPDW
jgi:alpha-L-fucosidase